MGDSLTRKIIRSHLVSGEMTPGKDIFIKVDQTLTHDVNAVMTYLAWEAVGLPRRRTELSVSYLDHNLLYINTNTPDDHTYLRTAAEKAGVYVSRPGNGICHTVHTARFAVPGKVLMGGDSHTPSGGAVGMLSIGVGGMDVATAMTGVPMRLAMPEIVKVNLTGKLRPGVNAKEIILEILRRVSLKGGLGRVYEYVGDGIRYLSVPSRMTIANMGAEMGATASIFPADETVRAYLASQERADQYVKLLPDADAEYDGEMSLDLSQLEPMIALPAQPDNVVSVRELKERPELRRVFSENSRLIPGTDLPEVQQVFIGSCTNSSYSDIAKAALILKGRHVRETVSCTMGIASRQIYRQLLDDGYISMLIDSGVRLLEISCGPCCAIGQVPPTCGISVRTSNRNFRGRAGSPDARTCLVSPETAAATAIAGTFATAEEILGKNVAVLDRVREPEHFNIDDSLLIKPLPPEEAAHVEIIRGPNIRPLPVPDAPEEHLVCQVSLKGGDNISTDDITPAGAEFSSMRSNIPMMSHYCYHRYDPDFAERARRMGKSVIIAGENYGQGSSREHAAIVPMYLGVRAVIAKNIARIHRSNLINHGIVPMLFENPSDYDKTALNDELEIRNFPKQIRKRRVVIHNTARNFDFAAVTDLTDSEMEVILDGGQLRHLKKQLKAEGLL